MISHPEFSHVCLTLQFLEEFQNPFWTSVKPMAWRYSLRSIGVCATKEHHWLRTGCNGLLRPHLLWPRGGNWDASLPLYALPFWAVWAPRYTDPSLYWAFVCSYLHLVCFPPDSHNARSQLRHHLWWFSYGHQCLPLNSRGLSPQLGLHLSVHR